MPFASPVGGEGLAPVKEEAVQTLSTFDGGICRSGSSNECCVRCCAGRGCRRLELRVAGRFFLESHLA